MKTIAAGAFKTNCLAIMDEVKAKRETIVITKQASRWRNRSIPTQMRFLGSSAAKAP